MDVPPWVGDASAVTIILTLVSGLYWLISSGKLVPKSTMDMVITQYDKLLVAKDKTIASQEKQIDDLRTGSETTLRLLQSLREVAQRQAEVSSQSRPIGITNSRDGEPRG